MDEQRLQEIKNSIGLIDCPECEMGRVSREGTFEDGQDYDRCETCDGSGMVSRFPEGHALIAEVRRLRQDRFHWMRHIADIADQRDAALAERDAARQEAAAAQADADALSGVLSGRMTVEEFTARNGAFDLTIGDIGAGVIAQAMIQLFKTGGATNFLTFRALTLEGDYSFTIQKATGITPEEKYAQMCVTLEETEAALTEARRVLREVLKAHSHMGVSVDWLHAEIAAVLAQEEK